MHGLLHRVGVDYFQIVYLDVDKQVRCATMWEYSAVYYSVC